MTHALHVWAEQARVATIEHEGRDDQWRLSYAEPWIADAQSYPLSPALPLLRPAANHASASIKRFIEHLLPEGRALDVAVAYNGLTRTNVFGLIWALGAETAGALRFTGVAPAAPSGGEPALREIPLQELDQRIASLEASLATLSKETADARAASEAASAALKAASDRDRAEISSLRSSLSKWKKATEEATAAYHRSEGLRVKLDAANASLERRAEARERQNLSLYKTGSEILQRYENFSLGRALAAREPFTGIARARLESQIKDYKDLLDDQKLKPSTAAASKPAPAPSSPAPAKP